MEHQKILNLLNEAKNSKFVTRKWNIVHDNSNTDYGVEHEINYNTEVLKYDLCDYNDAYILVRGDITVIGALATQVALKIVHLLLNVSQRLMDAEDLDLVITMSNLIEFS